LRQVRFLDLPLMPGAAPTPPDDKPRCSWVSGASREMVRYHDEEWCSPTRDPSAVFEALSLEAFQSGLSWTTIFNRREGFRDAFHHFDSAKVAAMSDDDVERLVLDEGIIRHRAKILATINNAKVAAEDPEALVELLWSYKDPHHKRPRSSADFRASSPESIALAKELKKRGYKFLGPTSVYALLQSIGVVDDHVVGCFCAART
jgi:DNA-3-methyladenine glycosylase I